MALIRVEERNILDEGFDGTNVRDMSTGRMSKQGAEKLGKSVRAGMSRQSSADRNQSKVSSATAAISKKMGTNTLEIQKIIETQSDETRDEISKLIKMLAESQKLTGEKSAKAIENIQKQTEIIKLTAGEQGKDLVKTLGISDAKKELTSRGSLTKNFFGVDQDAKGLDAVKQAFDPSRLFGGAGFFGMGNEKNKEKIAEREGLKNFQGKNQDAGLKSLDEVLVKKQDAAIDKSSKAISKTTKNGADKFSGSDRKSEDEKQTKFLENILKELKKLNEKNFGSASAGGGITNTVKKTGGVLAGVAATAASAFGLNKLFKRTPTPTPDIDPVTNNTDKKPTNTKPTTNTRPTTTTPSPDKLLDKNGKPLQGAARQSRINKLNQVKPTMKSKMFSRLGRLGSLGARAARFAGPLGLAVTAGAAAYEGYKGFNADPDASTADKFKNAGRGIGSMLSFGLIDSPEEAMQKRQIQNQMNPEIERPAGENSINDGYVPTPRSLPDPSELSPRPLPTGDAIENSGASTTNTNNITNNITNNNTTTGGGGGQSNPLITMKDTIRDSSSVIQRRFDKVYA